MICDTTFATQYPQVPATDLTADRPPSHAVQHAARDAELVSGTGPVAGAVHNPIRIPRPIVPAVAVLHRIKTATDGGTIPPGIHPGGH